MDYDFSGWATRNDLKCSDGRTIRKDAFKLQNKRKVPLFWNHDHSTPESVLGHAVLENRKEGVYAFCKFNNSQGSQSAKEAVMNGDITNLSIWATNLMQEGKDVLHGVIREVSLVPAGANPGAFIESVVCHGESIDDLDEEGIFYTDFGIEIYHADEGDEGDEEKKDSDSEETIVDVYETLNQKQKDMMAVVVAQAVADAKSESDDNDEDENEDVTHGEDEGGDEMKFNVFNQDPETGEQKYLSHSDFKELMKTAKQLNSFKEAIAVHQKEGGVLAHAVIPTDGMTIAQGKQTYGFNDPSMLFPDYRALTNTPEWLSRNMDWVGKVLAGVHHSPFSKVKSVFADITEDEARAKGYIKGKQKKEEVFTTLKRTTDPQTIYKRQKMDRDDILDITDFDVVSWIRAEMRVMLNEEIARAILIGDGRPTDSEDKIQEIYIRPIAKDVPLFNTKVTVTGTDAAKHIDDIIRARKHYKGSGNPTFFTTEDALTEMLLLKDGLGKKLYRSEAELATELRVKEIVTVEAMEGSKVGEDELIGVIVNLNDYNVGTNRGGEITMFDDFDINFNQYIYLIETRMSGALVKPFSALTIVRSGSSGVSTQSVFSSRDKE